MDGLNEAWKEYGKNENNLIVLQTHTDGFSITYWANAQGVLHPSIASGDGGADLINGQIFPNGGSTGIVFLIYPDKSYIGALSDHYYNPNNDKTWDIYLEEANIEKGIVDLKTFNNVTSQKGISNIYSSNNKISFNLLSSSTYTITLFNYNGRKIELMKNRLFKKGQNSFDHNLRSGGGILQFKNHNHTFTKRLIISD